jgi:predicted DsbA family dithiol-disulfide isomerase
MDHNEGTMPETGEDRLVVYSDYVCPFCYLGKRQLEAFLDEAEAPPEVTWRAFDLRRNQRTATHEIDPTAETGKTEAYYEQAKQNVERLADEYDVEMTWDVDRDVDSWSAHKLAIHTRENHDEATFADLHEAIFTALWREGRDIGDEDVLVDVAQEVGLDADEARQAIASDELDDELEDRFAASHRDGVTGVPTFAYGQLRVPGAVPATDIATLVENGRKAARNA